MTKSELQTFQLLLETKRAELSLDLRSRHGIAVERVPDSMDEAQLAGEREFAIRNLDRESSLLRSVCVALSRIGEGSYGSCLHCDEEISLKRLNAVPWASYCIQCQEAVDKQEIKPAMARLFEDAA